LHKQGKMTYVSGGGQVNEARSPWRLSIIPELFWGMLNFVVLFFQTLVNPGANKKGQGFSTDYRLRGRGGPGPFGPGGGGGPRRRMGGFRGGPGGPAAPPMAGGG